jgi:beta-lactam-binding protein with PASTA domain
LGNTEFNVPDVTGMGYDEAVAMLSGNGLNYSVIWEGNITDSATAVVYDQSPKAQNELSAPNRIKEGDMVDIRIKQNPTPEEFGGNKTPEPPVNNEENTNK